MSDTLPSGPKRVGILTGGACTFSGTRYGSVSCQILPYGLSGNLIPGPPLICSTWVPLGR
jgi:hypothetical protein